MKMRRAYKWLAFAVCFVLFLVMGAETVPLTDRAVVMGVGIDKTENGYNVTAQIVMPTDSESKSAGYIIVQGEGVSVSEALMNVSVEAGKQLSMSHCNAVVLGFGLIQHDAVAALDYMVRNAYLSENALLVAAENSAEEILSANPAFSDMSSLYLQTMLTRYGYYPVRTGRNIKEFLIAYNTDPGGNWLSVTSMKPIEGQVGGRSEQQSQYVFTFCDTAVFKGEDYITKLDERGTRGINYVENKLEEGSVLAECDGKEYTYFIEKISTKKKFSKDYSAKFEVKAVLVLKEIRGGDAVVAPEETQPDGRAAAALAEAIAGDIRYAYEETKKAGVDIFGLYEGFYSVLGKNFEPEGYSDRAVLEIDVDVSFV